MSLWNRSGYVMSAWLICLMTHGTYLWADGGVLSAENMRLAMQMIAQRSAANYEKLRSWQGEMVFEDHVLLNIDEHHPFRVSLEMEDGETSLRLQVKGRISFSVDVRSNRLLVVYRPTDTMCETSTERKVSTGGEWGDIVVAAQASLVVPEAFVHWQLDESPVLIEKADAARKHRGWTQVVDPRLFYTFQGAPHYYWKYIEDFLKWSHEEQPRSVSSEVYQCPSGNGGTLYHWKRSTTPSMSTDAIEQEFIFDESVACNPIQIADRQNGMVRIEQRVSYQEVEGIWVPAHIERRLFNPDNEVRFSRTVDIRHVEVNTEIPPGRFTLASMGLRNGVEVQDVERRRTFQYYDGMLVDASGDSTEYLHEYRSLLTAKSPE